ncbi:MAG: lasso RiPP family leader peptide-containing protein [Pyrinomonadaceae bacterium]|nr:lasso RiPP family leader peptide-containing protein [Pyrinomonadaceae bacterium]
MQQSTNSADKKPYTSPTVTVLGDIEAITQGFSNGDHLDASFPINTPFRDVTLS